MVGKFADFGHKYGKGFRKRAAHPHLIFPGVSPRASSRLLSLQTENRSHSIIFTDPLQNTSASPLSRTTHGSQGT